MKCNMHGSEPKCKTETQVEEEALDASRATNKQGAKGKTNAQITSNCRVVMAVKEENSIWNDKLSSSTLDHNARWCVSLSQKKTSLLNDLGGTDGSSPHRAIDSKRTDDRGVRPPRPYTELSNNTSTVSRTRTCHTKPALLCVVVRTALCVYSALRPN
jgi:hypothetical protein